MSGDKAAAGWATTGPATCEDGGFWMCTGHNYLNHGKNSTRGENVTVLCTHYFDYFLARPFTWADPDGGGGAWGPEPLKNHKNIGFHSNTGLDPLKKHKAT